MSEWLLPCFMNIHDYSFLLYSRKFMVQFYIHEYSRLTGIIHEFSRIYSMNILELFWNIHEIFMFMKAGVVAITVFILWFKCRLDGTYQ